MSYKTITQCANDPELNDRLQGAIAQEQAARDQTPEPTLHLYRMRWSLATASDVEAAYASALAGGNPSPGGDESVITDGMILANVQANWPEPV